MRHRYLPLFVAFLMLWSGYDLYQSLHYHHAIGFGDLFIFVIGLIYFVDVTIKWFKGRST